jgi:monothiol glutaredoxin
LLNSHLLISIDLDEPTRDRLTDLVSKNRILLFMKGNKLFPQCGFSNTACRILDQFNVPYETVDVLADEKIRSGVKTFSAWPTIPQLYVNGEFIGGSDIMIEMYKSGELAEMLEVAAAN